MPIKTILVVDDSPTDRQYLSDILAKSGYQATRTLSRDSATKDIPVIIVTTKGQETDRVWGMRQGARDYIVKPVSQADLLAKIAALG
jgi:twitching motility two-component system response regulator PilH